MTKIRKLLFVCFATALITSCTFIHTTSTSTYPIGPGHTPAFKVSGGFKLINPLPEGNLVKIGKLGAHTWQADLKHFTDTAIEYASDVLGSNNIGEGGSKSFELEIKNVKLDYTMATHFCELTLSVETGGGYKNNYSVKYHAAGPGSIARSMDGAVFHAVVRMFKDKKILNYIES